MNPIPPNKRQLCEETLGTILLQQLQSHLLVNSIACFRLAAGKAVNKAERNQQPAPTLLIHTENRQVVSNAAVPLDPEARHEVATPDLGTGQAAIHPAHAT